MSELNEAGRRVAGSAPQALTLFAKGNCPLCDEARDVLEATAGAAGIRWDEADILADERLFDAYRYRVPVLRAGGEDVLYGRFPPRAVRRVLGLSPPVPVLCLGLEAFAAALASAGVAVVHRWEDGPRLAAVAAGEAGRFAPVRGIPAVLVGDRSAAGAGVVAVLPDPLYVPDLVALIESLVP